MSSEEATKILEKFNIRVNNEVAYNFIEDISDASNILWDYLVNDRSLSFEERNLIIGYICLDYIENPFVKDKLDDLAKAIAKFNEDNIFGVNVLDEYIDKYFQDAILINNYNRLNLDYSFDLELDDSEVVDRIYEVLNNSSFFNGSEKEIIFKYLVYSCKSEIDNNKHSLIFDEHDFSDQYLSDLDYYYDHLDEVGNDKEFVLNLIEHYFSSEIEDDFKDNRLEAMVSALLKKDNKIPPKEEIERLYDEIIYKDEEYGYSNAIVNMLEFIERQPLDSYDTFVSDKEFGVEELIKFYKLSVNENFTEEESVEFINEIGRDILYNLIEDFENVDANTSEIEYYFDMGFGTKEYYDCFNNNYNIPFKDMMNIQKLSLISDYYNRYYDNKMKDDTINFNLNLISSSKRGDLIRIFDENYLFRKSCIESFVECAIIDQKNVNLCSDINTLYEINPFLILEMSSNKAYQKKLD